MYTRNRQYWLLFVVLIMSMLACNTTGAVNGITPVPEASTSNPTTGQTETVQLPSQNQGGDQETPQIQLIPTPPIATPTPPVSYETDGVIEVWSLTNQKFGVDQVAEAGAFGLVLVAADGPLPVGDVVALVVVGGAMVLYAVAVAPEVAAALTDAVSNLGAVQMAQNPDNLLLPPVTVPIPAVPDHILNHPRGPYTARLKEAIWITVFTAWFSNQPPDWCGRRPTDGAIAIVYYGLQITTRMNNKVYTGLALLLNQGGDHLSTGFKDVFMENGRPCSGNCAGNDFDQFDPFPCPPPDGLKPITQ